MLKSSAKNHFKSLAAIAKVLGVTKSAVSQWPRVIPKGSACELQILTRGKLKVNPRLYAATRRGQGSRMARA